MTGPYTRGIVLREESDVLVVQATPEEVASFALGQGVHVVAGAPEPAETRSDTFRALMDEGGLLYDRHGRVVARVTSMRVSRDSIDMTTAFDSAPVLMSGRRHVHIEAEGV